MSIFFYNVYMNRFAIYQKGIGMMLGLIFGAGIFALPASVARAGLWWGTVHFIVAFFLMLVVHLWFAEVAFASDGKERFTGFVRKWMGARAAFLSLLMVVVGYFGSLLAYGVLGGIFLHALFPFFSVFSWSLIFFVSTTLFGYFDFKKISVVNFYLSIPLVLFVLYLAGVSVPHISLENFAVGSSAFWFLPYGIFLFAFSGIAAIPETRDIMRPLGLSHFRIIIVWSLIISAILYAFFILAVVGVTGEKTTDDALTGLAEVMGSYTLFIGALIGFLAVFTSHLSLAADMKNIFYIDYSISEKISWLSANIPPVLLYLFGFAAFLEILSFVGSFIFGLTGVFIFVMARNLHKAYPEHIHPILSTKRPFAFLILALLIAGVAVELARLGAIL